MPSPLSQTTSEHAGLTVRTVGPPVAEREGEEVRAAAVLCHGFGAPGTDLVGLAEELLRIRPALAGRVRLHFPAGLLDLTSAGMPGARAWWLLDVRRFGMPPGELVEILRSERPRGVKMLRERIDALMDSLLTVDGLPSERIVIGGFSQGAMVTTDYALRSDRPLGGLAVLSGALCSEAEWTPWAAAAPKRRVYQTHGTADAILPFATGEALRDVLTDAGHEVRFQAFAGPHTIPPAALEGVADLLEAAMGDG